MQNSSKFSQEEETLIMEQMKCLHNELCSIQSSFLGIISVPVAVYGLLIYYGLQLDDKLGPSRPANTLFIVMPFLFLLSVFNILKYTIKMLGMGAYVRHLEGQLNASHRKHLFIWRSYLINANSYAMIGGMFQLPCFFALAIFIGYEYLKNINQCNLFPCCKFVFTGLLVIQIIAILYMLLICATQSKTVKYWCATISTLEFPAVNLHSEFPLFLGSSILKAMNHSWFKRIGNFIEKSLFSSTTKE